MASLLDILARALLESVESSLCCVSLVEGNGSTLSIYASRAHRNLDKIFKVGRSFPTDALPIHKWVIDVGQTMVLQRRQAETQLKEPELSLLFSPPFQAVALVPLAVRGRTFGLAILGEMRNWQRSPLSGPKLDLARSLAQQAALAVQKLQKLDSVTRQNTRVLAFANSVADGILVADAEGIIQLVNSPAERLLGLSADEIRGRKCAEVIQRMTDGGPAPCRVDCPMRDVRLFARETPVVQFSETILRPDGTSSRVSHRMTPIFGNDGQPTGIISIFHDVSGEEEALHLSKEYLSLVAHELRAPLGNIAASAELLSKPEIAPTVKEEMAKTLGHECQRLSRLVHQVLQADRLESGRIALTLEPLLLQPLIDETVRSFRTRYSEYVLEVMPARRPIIVAGDAASVQVILENLIQNAINYSEPGQAITISVTECDDQVIVSIVDRGRGIPSNQLSSIFERFRRGTGTEGRRVTGFGLGLYIAKMLAEAQGGTIGAESEPGQGSCFHFTLNLFEETHDSQDPRD